MPPLNRLMRRLRISGRYSEVSERCPFSSTASRRFTAKNMKEGTLAPPKLRLILECFDLVLMTFSGKRVAALFLVWSGK